MSLLEVKDLSVHFHDARPERFAVGGISFSMEEGEILGLVGESGSGKTVTAMCLSGLLPVGKADKGGSITLDGHEIFACSERELNRILGREMTVVFQEPMTSFNPLYRIGRQIEEGLYVHEKKLSAAERKERALDAMARSGLNDPEQVYRKYPHELSGNRDPAAPGQPWLHAERQPDLLKIRTLVCSGNGACRCAPGAGFFPSQRRNPAGFKEAVGSLYSVPADPGLACA